MHEIIEKHISDFDSNVEFVKKDMATLRTGRANPIMVENIAIDSYGVKTPLKQLASINVPEARTLVIQPWDQNLVKEIEKGIIDAKLGISPVNEGKVIRLTVPQLTAESRQELVKNVHKKLEEARIKIRSVRDKIRDEILSAHKNNAITEDDKFDALKELDSVTKDYNDTIKELGEAKEKEIMTI